MFNFTFPELVVIFVVALIVFGPKRLPELGRALGKALGELQRSLQGVREHMNAENNTTGHEAKPGQKSDHDSSEGVADNSQTYGGPQIVDAHDSDGREQNDTSHAPS
ncbi:MAG: twin-arginine translocase TatA/TatE family subunit [Dissulfurispiraceae bacterium]|jgi:TatA/E family protein of Tat protein translocase